MPAARSSATWSRTAGGAGRTGRYQTSARCVIAIGVALEISGDEEARAVIPDLQERQGVGVVVGVAVVEKVIATERPPPRSQSRDQLPERHHRQLSPGQARCASNSSVFGRGGRGQVDRVVAQRMTRLACSGAGRTRVTPGQRARSPC